MTSPVARRRRRIGVILMMMAAASSHLCGDCLSQGMEGKSSKEVAGTVRKALGAGRWFPANKNELKQMVDAYMEGARPVEVGARIVGAIAPHAGYIYSGKVAGTTFSAIRHNAAPGQGPDTVVLLGFGHRGEFPGVALMDGDAIETPLGQAALDKEAADILVAQSSRIYLDYKPHIGEHSAENEIPFLQTALPDAKLVVGLMGDHYPLTLDELVAALVELGKRKSILVVASSDMMHHPDYELVTKTDKNTLETVKRMDHAALYNDWKPSRQTFCGIGPVVTVMRFAESHGCKEGRVLEYRNSGDDFPESRGQWVVGYASVVFVTAQ